MIRIISRVSQVASGSRFVNFASFRSFSAASVESNSIAAAENVSPALDALGRAYATGRRKTSVARVWLKEGSGQVVVNDANVTEYFQPLQRLHCLEPFTASNSSGLFDVWCTVKGGGISGVFVIAYFH
jgi:small subunit ribosomal protein S9